MKIAVDARMINMSGIGTYIQNLMKNDCYDIALGRKEEIEKICNKVDTIEFDSPIYGIKEQLKLYNKNTKIGIYGSGQDCTAFLDLIRYFWGEFKCKIFYIQTEKVLDCEKNLYSVDDINDLNLDCVFIGSYYYEEEMLENISKMSDGRRYKVYSMRKDFHYYDVNY